MRWLTTGRLLAGTLLFAGAVAAASEALAQTSGGILRIYHRDTSPGASIHEEATISTLIPFMAVYNNLVMYKQDEPRNSLDSIVPDLAKSWSWNTEQTAVTFKLHEGVKWHDGQRFTANDVKCTWDMLADRTGEGKLRKNPRKGWYHNLKEVTTNGDHEVTFHLGRPQPSFMALLASGFSPVYPCHVPLGQMRTKPIGTGPFKLVEFNPAVAIKLAKNTDYFKKGRPYLDGIDYKVISNRATAMLAFLANELDLTFPGEVSIPILKDLQRQAPKAVCQVHPTNVSTNLIINHGAAPFSNPELVKAVMLGLDRKGYNDILYQGQATVGGAMLPSPEGVWGMPPGFLDDVPGYSGTVAENREQARAIMRKHGYGPDNRLKIKVAVRNIALFRDPAVVVLDQLKDIWIDAEMELIETPQYAPKMTRKDYIMSAGMVGSGLDDPDQQFYENYVCGSERNLGQYCDKELDQMIDQQSRETDPEKRKRLVWDIDRKLQREGVRPILSHYRAATCWHPRLQGFTVMQNSLYNGWRFEDIWLAK
ncbi:MAG TPA: ABC transporter substrate-binding protein [Hyphomicrobiaceae bacterium]|nr:ABC transporter substrate-binding protein [Hyphomicrobiaceae bacterium]